jgi:hypothetical protein
MYVGVHKFIHTCSVFIIAIKYPPKGYEELAIITRVVKEFISTIH